jgi:hypothetical protein
MLLTQKSIHGKAKLAIQSNMQLTAPAEELLRARLMGPE